MACDPPFRIEADGPPLPSASPLYAAGEASCRPGPARPDRSYAAPCLGVVIEGGLEYRSPSGSAVVARGAVVFGNLGEPFRCRHLDAGGARRAVMAFHAGLVDEVANDCGLAAPVFGAAVLPASRAAAGLYGAARRAALGRLGDDEVLLALGEALRLSHGRAAPARERGDEARIGRTLARMAAEFDQPLGLDELARTAGLSRFHYVRVFRALTGETPHQHLIGLRLRAAADRLIETREPVTEIAFAVGFNDLSHFNATFRRAFGQAPGAWRRAA